MFRCFSFSGDSLAMSSSRMACPAAPQLGDGGVEVAAVPQGHGVQHQAEGAELVFLAFAVGLVDLPAPGNTIALRRAADLLWEAGRTEEALTWLQSRAEAGDTDALRRAADLLQEADRTEEADVFTKVWLGTGRLGCP